MDEPRRNLAEAARVACDITTLSAGDRVEVAARYWLRPRTGSPEIALTDRKQGDVDRWSCSLGPVQRLRGSDDGVFLIESNGSDISASDYIQLRARFPARSFLKPVRSPVCVLPAHLPQLLTAHGPYVPPESGLPARSTAEPRLELRTPWPDPHGMVRDADGHLLMVALPLSRALRESVVHADERVVLCGKFLRTVPDAELRFIVERHQAILQFLDRELGFGDRIRALCVYDEGAGQGRFGLEAGHLVTWDKEYLQVLDPNYLPGERLFARGLASIWWRHGVRPAGELGPGIAVGLSAYLVLRWFENVGDVDRLTGEREFLAKVARDLSAKREPARYWELLGAELAIALDEAQKRGSNVGDELRSWCATEWGNAISPQWIKERLSMRGVIVPW